MVAKLTVIVFIVLCFELGLALTLLPWVKTDLVGDWGNNYIIASLAQETGLPIIQKAMSSGWVRGAVSALGLLNIFIGIWEILNFKQSVKMIETGGDVAKK